MDINDYYNNCIYNFVDTGQVLIFKSHNIIAKIEIKYEKMLKYYELQLSAKQQYLFALNLIRNLQIIIKLVIIYKIILNNFTIQIQSNNHLIDLKFPLT